MPRKKPAKKLSGSAHQRAKGLVPILSWVTPEQKESLREAAEATGIMTITGFLVSAGLEKAAEVKQRK